MKIKYIFIMFCSLLFSQEALVSGTAFATHRSKYYYLDIDSGMSRSIPVNSKGAPVKDYFENENKNYAEWLKRAAAELDVLIEEVITKNEFPIVAYNVSDKKNIKLEKITQKNVWSFYLHLTVTKKLAKEQQEILCRDVENILERHR